MSFITRALIKNTAEDICRHIDETYAVDVDLYDIMSIISFHARDIIDAVEEGVIELPED